MLKIHSIPVPLAKLAPLDFGLFGPLKKAYGGEISFLVRANIVHITKDDFFPVF
jgi:hypothetical protein